MVVQYTISNIGAGNPFETYWLDRLVNLYIIFFFAVYAVIQRSDSMCISMLTHLKQGSTALHPKTLFKYKTSLKDTFTILPKGMGTIDALTLG